jgi:hypothetical protein
LYGVYAYLSAETKKQVLVIVGDLFEDGAQQPLRTIFQLNALSCVDCHKRQHGLTETFARIVEFFARHLQHGCDEPGNVPARQIRAVDPNLVAGQQ